MAKSADVIYIPAKRRKQWAVVRVNSDAYNALVDIYNESTLPMAQIASMLICNAAAPGGVCERG